MLISIFLFACVGAAFEVIFTAIVDFSKTRNLRLMGHTYLWMFPLYGLAPLFLGVLYPRLAAWPLLARVGIYAALLMLLEYVSGWLLRTLTGTCPWESDYYGHRWAIRGLVRLDYFPAWALACFLFERLYLALHALA